MAILHRQTPRVNLPPDFGLGLAVTSVLAAIVLVIAIAGSAISGSGPRTESRTPDGAGTYTDIQAPAEPVSVLPTP